MKRRRMMALQSNGKLPSEFQEVEYAESNDTSCCINTEIIPTQTFEYDFIFYNGERYDQDVYILGTAGTAEEPRLNLGLRPNENRSYSVSFNSATGSATTFVIAEDIFIGEKHEIILSADITSHSYYFKIDSFERTRDYNPNLPYNFPLRLFTIESNQRPGAAKMRVYHFSLKNNGVLVRDMIPCRRKSDNVAGLYDLCGSICSLTNSPFYINAGSGLLIAGGDIN